MNEVKNSNENHEPSTFIGWVKKHKKGIRIAGGVVVAIGTGYVVYKNWGFITAIFKNIKPEPLVTNNTQVAIKVTMPVVDVIPESPTESVSKIINNGEPFGVCGHPRNLSNGRNASAEKIALALEHGIELKEHQTWVENYFKNCA
jgi:hypothetical protein